MRARWEFGAALVGVAAVTSLVVLYPIATAAVIGAAAIIAAVALIPERVALAATVIGALSILILLPSNAVSHLPGGSFYPIGAAILLLGAGLIRGRHRLRRPPWAVTIAGFFLFASVSSLLYTEPNPFSLLLPAVILPAYWMTYSSSETERRAIAVTVVALAAFEAVLGLSEVFLGLSPLLGDPFRTSPINPFIDGAARAQGTLAHPLVLGFLLLAALMPLNRMTRFGQIALLAVVLVAIIGTGATSGVIVAAIVVVLRLLASKNYAVVAFTVLALSAAAIWVIADGLLVRLFGEELNLRNAGHRWNSIAGTPNLFFQRDLGEMMIGSGYGGVASLYERGIFYNDGFYTIDNQFVSFIASGGLLGAICILVAIVGITVRMRREYLAGWLGFLAMGLSFDFIYWYVPATLFFMYAALGMRRPPADVSLGGQVTPTQQSAPTKPQRRTSRASRSLVGTTTGDAHSARSRLAPPASVIDPPKARR